LQVYRISLWTVFQKVHGEGKSVAQVFQEENLGMSRSTFYALLREHEEDVKAIEEAVVGELEVVRQMEAAALTTARAEASIRLNRRVLDEADGVFSAMMDMLHNGESEIARARIFEIFFGRMLPEGVMTPRERAIERDPAALPAAPAPHESWKPTPFADLAELAKKTDGRKIVILTNDGGRLDFTPASEPIDAEGT